MARRNSLRHDEYNYRSPGAYFITICTHNRQHFFGRIENGKMILSELGTLADTSWIHLANRHSYIEPDTHQVMPNHVHLLFWLKGLPTLASSPTLNEDRNFAKPLARTVSSIIGGYKSSVTQRAQQIGFSGAGPIWHRNFHDSIVRGETALERIRAYIRNNPSRWEEDRFNR